AVAHPEMDRAAERGRHRRRAADDQRGRHEAALARGPGHRRRPARGHPGERARAPGRLFRGAQGGGMSLTELTIAAARDGLANKEFSARELAEAHLRAM